MAIDWTRRRGIARPGATMVLIPATSPPNHGRKPASLGQLPVMDGWLEHGERDQRPSHDHRQLLHCSRRKHLPRFQKPKKYNEAPKP
jgi:hypothetical protein